VSLYHQLKFESKVYTYPMSLTESINTALVKFNYQEVTTQQLAEHLLFTSDEQKLLKLFWEPTFNQGWIYLSPDFITQDMGYKKVSDFYNDILRPHYIEGIDYIEIKKDNDLVEIYEEYKRTFTAVITAVKTKGKRGGGLKKYYKITGKTLKKMLMKCGTKKGDQICEYYLKIEQLAIFMKDYITALHERILQQQMSQLAEEKKRLTEEKNQADSKITELTREVTEAKNKLFPC
jgi:hypothetical protein